MKYKFNLKIQIVFGIISFLSALGILYLFTGKLDFLTSTIIGIMNFVVAGFYNFVKCK